MIDGLFGKDIGKEIVCIPLSSNAVSDVLVWPFTKNGCYSVKRGYQSIFGNLSNRNKTEASSSFEISGDLWN